MSRIGLFRDHGVAFAIPLPRLLKVISGERCYLLPRLPRAVAGVVVWDKQLIPQLDVGRLLDCSAEVVGQAVYQVLVASECGILALSADQTCGIVAESAGVLESTTEKVIPGIAGEFHFRGTVFQVLDIDSLAIDLIQ